ncbi:uncharacterized protein Dana_GF14859 [Drosophila ananassae]|uniref:BHLH domain-containing protein n=1 Tax=Drosophila ananassae TaxID=7217 RepID=B3MLU5_DROAN|nr:protein atonal homolog 8 [Drosophila ananassae]EDV30816.2 uncharacterized protein Dana_GF14859 [Drosophila ananassae]
MASVQPEKLYMHLSAAELAAIIMKDSPNSNDRDAGFCSASSESEGGDDLAVEHAAEHGSGSGSPAPNSLGPKGAPEEFGSPECKPIAVIRNKRKSSEPSKVVGTSSGSGSLPCPCPGSYSMNATGPLKKRIRYTSSADSAVVLTPPAVDSPPPVLPSATSSMRLQEPAQPEAMPNPAHVFVRHPGVTTLHRTFTPHPEQLEPLALVTKRKLSTATDSEVKPETELSRKSQTVKKSVQKKVPKGAPSSPLQDLSLSVSDEDHVSHQPPQHSNQHQQRNYKNMTRERRIEANARERTRVHTISAAYETLRRAVPAYASSQKLSKLSVLRVACSYILTLSRMAGEDYSADQSEPSIAECMEAVTATIQTEGKVKRRKDE